MIVKKIYKLKIMRVLCVLQTKREEEEKEKS